MFSWGQLQDNQALDTFQEARYPEDQLYSWLYVMDGKGNFLCSFSSRL